MQNGHDYERFLADRLKDALKFIKEQYDLLLIFEEINEFEPSSKNTQKNDTKNFGHKLFNGLVSFQEKKLFFVIFRSVIKRNLVSEMLANERNNLPIIVFSFNKFLLIQQKRVIEFKKDDIISVILRILGNEQAIDKKALSDIREILNTSIREKFKREISFDYEDIFFDSEKYIYSFTVEAANQFFNKILKTHLEDVCRYTSQESIFRTIDLEKQRMFSIAGMNDKEEISFVDGYIYGKSFTPTSSRLYNEKFILSCSTMKSSDKLTLYRLYADDAKGVCIQYEVNPFNNCPDFYIKEVEYSDEKGICPTLELIKSICDSIWKKTRFRFDFFGNSGWKYFFKPFDYSIENEVRLLYNRPSTSISQRGWVITHQNCILNPYLEFDLCLANNPPLIIKQVILGPKHPEKEINLIQFQELIKDHSKNLGSISIILSNITSYR